MNLDDDAIKEMNNESRFTPGQWRVMGRGVYAGDGKIVADTFYADANAALIAASPELYDNEAKNLTTLKAILKCYQDIEKLMMTDEDVKAVIQNDTIYGILMPEAVHVIIEYLKTRITETERVLAKARGDSNNA